jgi:hypothetical protein
MVSWIQRRGLVSEIPESTYEFYLAVFIAKIEMTMQKIADSRCLGGWSPVETGPDIVRMKRMLLKLLSLICQKKAPVSQPSTDSCSSMASLAPTTSQLSLQKMVTLPKWPFCLTRIEDASFQRSC